MEDNFQVLFLEEARLFLIELDEKTRIKILYNIDKAKKSNDPKLFKKLTGEIWEFRTRFNKKQYRLFAFWDKEEVETLVVSTHGMVKRLIKSLPKKLKERKEFEKFILMKSNHFGHPVFQDARNSN